MIGVLVAGAALATTLDEARTAAMDRAIGVQRQQVALDRARGEALGSLAETLPQIGVFATASASSGPNPFGRFRLTQVQAGVSGSWRLVDPAGWGAAAAARSTVRGEQALLDWAQAMARRDATAAFADAAAAREVAEALRTAEEDASRAASGIRDLVDAGLRPEADAVQAEAVAAALTAERVAAEGEIAATCASLQVQMGVPIDGHCALAPSSAWPEPSTGPDVHPALQAADEALSAARRARGASLLASAPVVVGTAEAAQNQGSAVVGDNTDDARDLSGLSLSAGLRADLPVVGSGSGVARESPDRSRASSVLSPTT
ncbi:MAG: TolC family protein, partial [Myxococcota bacterium]